MTRRTRSRPAGDAGLDGLAEDYVRLALAIGRHDGDLVDAYFGPEEWRRRESRGRPASVPRLLERARDLLARLRSAAPTERRLFLETQTVAAEALLRRLAGEAMSLREEARLLFDIDLPVRGTDELGLHLSRAEALLPGRGEFAARVKAFRDRFIIPPGRLKTVAQACLAEARARSAAVLPLPAGERLRLALVHGKPWRAYNWYRGGFQSLVEVNADLSFHLGSLMVTIFHEGYPGHHAHHSVIEKELVRGKGWLEASILLLHSPQVLIAEGVANAGLQVLLNEEDRVSLLRDVLAPAAGLDDRLDITLYERLRTALKPLDEAVAEGARRLLLGEIEADDAVAFMRHYGLAEELAARRTVEFARRYRAYVFSYTTGELLVRDHVGEGPDRIDRYARLFRSLPTPSALASGRQKGR
ncbi:MAG TPA: hypothetical protein VFT43_11070 [Candidatus Polarisedimenticolia bacterium]|nr:hypothetical protein [Candidatus Polarisedimenticolia bacterium]